jgi:hypothetical protein
MNLERAGLHSKKDMLDEKLKKNIDSKARVGRDLDHAYAE